MKHAGFSNKLYLVLSISIKFAFVTEISSQKIFCSMIRTTSRLSTLGCPTCTTRVILWKLHVEVHVTQLLRWLLENVTMAWTLIYGVVVLFCMQWHVDIFHSKTQTQASCTKRFWIAIIWYQDLYPSLQKNLSRKSSILIQSKDLRLLTSGTTNGTARWNHWKWRVSLSVKTESPLLKSS